MYHRLLDDLAVWPDHYRRIETYPTGDHVLRAGFAYASRPARESRCGVSIVRAWSWLLRNGGSDDLHSPAQP